MRWWLEGAVVLAVAVLAGYTIYLNHGTMKIIKRIRKERGWE